MTDIPEENPKEVDAVEKLHQDVKNSIIILQRIDHRTEKDSIKLDTILEQSLVAHKMLAENTKSIAGSLKDSAETNKELLNVALGKKQIPMSMYLGSMVFLLVLELVALAAIFGISSSFNMLGASGAINTTKQATQDDTNK